MLGLCATAALVGLQTLGKLSDHTGRRPVLLTALAVQAGSLLTFATATELLAVKIGPGPVHWCSLPIKLLAQEI